MIKWELIDCSCFSVAISFAILVAILVALEDVRPDAANVVKLSSYERLMDDERISIEYQ